MTITLTLHQCIFSNKPKLSDLKGFVSGTSYVVFLNTFFVLTSSPPCKTSFWARPLKTKRAKPDGLTNALKKFVLELFLAAFLKKRMMRVTSTEKQLKVLKVRHMFVYFWCSNCQIIFLGFSFSNAGVSVCQRLKGKEEWKRPLVH